MADLFPGLDLDEPASEDDDGNIGIDLNEPEDDHGVDEVDLDEPPLENGNSNASVISFASKHLDNGVRFHLTTATLFLVSFCILFPFGYSHTVSCVCY
jgi:hypothetical protein